MSLQVIKSGVLDSIQDGGRNSFQHLGVNTGGVMDRFAAARANALLGKDLDAPVLECHFPAGQYRFDADMVICITGADFCPQVNGIDLPLNQAVVIGKNALLQFRVHRSGMRCYIAFAQEPALTPWLNSYSTHLKAGAGGFAGRPLKNGDRIMFSTGLLPFHLENEEIKILPWKAPLMNGDPSALSFLTGPEWTWLSREAEDILLQQPFYVQADSDRMGMRLNGMPMTAASNDSLVSSPVTFGTIQLLPNGQLIVLMADHQTTGGYPRIGTIISTDLPVLAQQRQGTALGFQKISLSEAEEKIIRQQQYLDDLQALCRQNMQVLLQQV